MTARMLCLPLILLGLVSCKESTEPVEITKKRELTVYDEPRAGLTPIMPPEWRQVPGTQFRAFNYRFGKDGEVYISNARGSVLENANRWYKQYGKAEVPTLEGLNTVDILGQKGVLIEASGTFAGGMGKLPKENAGLLGAIVDFGGDLITIKMIGSSADVAAEKERFMQFATSLRR